MSPTNVSMQAYFKISKVLFTIFICIYFVCGDELQDPSEVKYKNPKYIKDIRIVTFRRRRSDSYKTNVTLTTYHTWGNNITLRGSYLRKDGKMFNISLKACGAMDQIWLLQLMKQVSDLTDCPVPAGTHKYYNLDVIPKVFPAPMPITPRGSSGRILVESFMTATKERVLEVSLRVHIK